MEIFNKDVSVLGGLTLNPSNATGNFLLIDGTNIVKFRTPSEVLSDINGINKDGSVALTADWDAGAFDITAVDFNATRVFSTDSISIGTIGSAEKLHIGDGNILLEGGGETAFRTRRLTTFTNSHLNSPFINPTFQIGRIIQGGDGAPQFRWMYNDDVIGETVVMELDSEGIMSSVRQERGSHFEGHIEGEFNPFFRINSYPDIRLEFGEGGIDGTDVSISRPSANQIAFNRGVGLSEVESVRIDENGFVGINIDDPQYRLHVFGSAYAQDGLLTSGIKIGWDTIEQWGSSADGASVAINYNGYLGGNTKYRNLGVFDGRNGIIWDVVGSTRRTQFYGMVGMQESLEIVGNATVADEAYTPLWSASFQVPTKNAIFNKIENLSITESQISDLQSYSLTIHNHSLDSLTDTTVTDNSSGEILKWSGTAWVNNTLAEAGISAVGHTHTFASLTSKPTTISGYGITDFNSLWDTRLGLKSTTDLAEGTNLYYTEGRVSANTSVVANTAKVSFPGWGSVTDHTDVVSATNTNRFALISNGTTGYIGRAIVEADISDLQAYLTSFDITTQTDPKYLRSDITDIKTAGNLTFDNNVKITFGTGSSESEIYSDSVDTNINLKSGNLKIQNNGVDVFNIARTTGTVSIDGLGSNKILLSRGTGNARVGMQTNIDGMYFTAGLTGVDLIIHPSGNIGVLNSIDNGYAFDVSGTGRFTGNLTLDDNAKLSLGTLGAESEIYSDATDTIIDLKLGDFKIQNNGIDIFRIDRIDGRVGINLNPATPTSYPLQISGTIKANEIVLTTYFVAGLPTAAQGMRANVIDATATTFHSIVVGGGSNFVPVFYDGTNWRIG